MRKFLLASVATLGRPGDWWVRLWRRHHQGRRCRTPLSAPAPISGPIGAPTQGQQAWPAAPSPVAYVNTNNNYQAPMLPGALANPTPGTIVVHINAKVQMECRGSWTSARQSPCDRDGRAGSGNADHQHRQRPAGGRYCHVRQRGADCHAWVGKTASARRRCSRRASAASHASIPAATAWRPMGCATAPRSKSARTSAVSPAVASASTYSSLETLYVRRAFTYVAGDNWGIVRAGQADGLIGIFDNGVTTFQFLPTGNFNGGDATNFMPGTRRATFISWPRRATNTTTQNWSICRRRSPGSTSASSTRRTPRTATARAAATCR